VYGYLLCNIKVTVKGAYIDISDLISDIENDDELGFEINDFSMQSGVANFTLKDVPIESSTLIQSSTSSTSTDEVDSSSTTTDTSEETSDTNTVQ
jgi:hypothetical protein